MLLKTRRLVHEFHAEGVVDARVKFALRWMDSIVAEWTRPTPYHVAEITITSLIRTRQEQLAINQRRKGQGGRWAEIDLRWESWHEKGGAADVRIRDWPRGTAREVADATMRAFPEIEVIVESDHLHVELREVARDPANPWKIATPIEAKARVRFEVAF